MSKKRTALKFKCPNCDSEQLESIETNVVLSSEIATLNEDGDFDYESPLMDGGEIDRFQCFKCGYVLRDSDGKNLTNNEEVVEWVKKNCKQNLIEP